MTELWIWEQNRTRQRFCGSLDRALEGAREALEQGKAVQIIPDNRWVEQDETL